MPFVPNNVYHVYNQGNNRQRIFHFRKDYLVFLTLYKRLFPACCSTIAWCLMPNHFHFMIHTDDRCGILIRQGGINIDPVTNSIRKLLSGYARIFNTEYNHSGSVFRQKTKSKCLSDIEIKPGSSYELRDYFVNCFHYIHQNPVVANLTDKPEDWEFSSYSDYAGLRCGNLCTKELAEQYCGYYAADFTENSNKLIDKKLIELFA